MYKYRLFVGRNDKDAERVKISKRRALKMIDIVLQSHDIKGYTILDAIGVWQGKREKSFVIEINSEFGIMPIINVLAHELDKCLNQNCIMVEDYQCRTNFI